jgi:hypothetical protein
MHGTATALSNAGDIAMSTAPVIVPNFSLPASNLGPHFEPTWVHARG